VTTPQPISKYRPANTEDGDRQPFTDKNEIANVPIVITGGRNIPGKNGRFWVIEATRQDTGEVITFNGSKVIDETMATVDAAKAYPVAAMLVKVEADNPQGFYWNIIDPPAATPVSNGTDRVAEIQALLPKWGLFVDDVTSAIKEVVGEEKKIRDLDDDQYAAVKEILEGRAVPDEPPF
jgi:hypothetical protein